MPSWRASPAASSTALTRAPATGPPEVRGTPPRRHIAADAPQQGTEAPRQEQHREEVEDEPRQQPTGEALAVADERSDDRDDAVQDGGGDERGPQPRAAPSPARTGDPGGLHRPNTTRLRDPSSPALGAPVRRPG